MKLAKEHKKAILKAKPYFDCKLHHDKVLLGERETGRERRGERDREKERKEKWQKESVCVREKNLREF